MVSLSWEINIPRLRIGYEYANRKRSWIFIARVGEADDKSSASQGQATRLITNLPQANSNGYAL